MNKQKREGGRGHNSKKEGDAHMLEEDSEDHSDATPWSSFEDVSCIGDNLCTHPDARC
jgi:hypothetical protein